MGPAAPGRDALVLPPEVGSEAENGEVLLAMHAKMNRLLDTEAGEDHGQMLPGGAGGEVTAGTMAP